MQECAVVFFSQVQGIGSILNDHSVVVRVMLLLLIFGVGYAEAKILKSRGVASTTWFLELAAVSFWIGFPATALRIVAGSGIFLCGSIAIIVFLIKTPPCPK